MARVLGWGEEEEKEEKEEEMVLRVLDAPLTSEVMNAIIFAKKIAKEESRLFGEEEETSEDGNETEEENEDDE